MPEPFNPLLPKGFKLPDQTRPEIEPTAVDIEVRGGRVTLTQEAPGRYRITGNSFIEQPDEVLAVSNWSRECVDLETDNVVSGSGMSRHLRWREVDIDFEHQIIQGPSVAMIQEAMQQCSIFATQL